MSKRSLRPEEQRAWARVTRSIKALSDRAVQPSSEEPAATGPKGTRSSNQNSAASRPVPAIAKPGGIANRQGERRVRRGRLPISATLDLHGHTQASAHGVLAAFLARQRTERATCVLVITGKGRDGEGILRRRFLQWLESAEASGQVSGYAPAHQKHGGAGAWYVFLRRL